MSRLIYADNAATTQLDAAAFEAMKPFLLNEYGNVSQLYSFARKPKKAVQEARETIAACIGAFPEEICISTGSACNSKSTETSHVLQAIGLEDNYARGTIRISLGKMNTEEDVEAIFTALAKIFL